MYRARRVLARTLLVLAILAAAALVAVGVAVIYLGGKGTQLDPAPNGQPKAEVGQEEADDGFPYVDWEYWRGVNPDVVGWITIPGTQIDFPIVQAPEWNPTYYLDHDVYREWNYVGCPYLDAECAQGGLMNSMNAVVFGHNMGWSSEMFADLANYSDESYATSHRQVFLQTPDTKRVYSVQAADVIPGWEAVKRVDFTDREDLFSWWGERYAASDMKLGKGAYAQSMLTLCTCSYNYWSSERTLVYCM